MTTDRLVRCCTVWGKKQKTSLPPPTSLKQIGVSTSIKQYDNFFQVRKNVIFERARFNCRFQAVGESVEQFIISLYTLAENCDYCDLKDQMIHNRIVVGIRYQAQSEWLQMDAGLTLEKAKTLV